METTAGPIIPEGRAVVIFDGVCNFCQGSVQFLLRRDRRGRFLFASNQSDAGRALLRRFGVDPERVESVYLVEGDRIWAKSDATLAIARRMGFPWRLGAIGAIVPRPIRDAVYDWIARNRYRWFGRAESCHLPSPAERARFLA